MDRRILASIKHALKCLASVNDERNGASPLSLKDSRSSISRLSAYLHLFHHQACHSAQLVPTQLFRLCSVSSLLSDLCCMPCGFQRLKRQRTRMLNRPEA